MIGVLLLGVLGLVGCASKGEVITLDMDRAAPSGQPAGGSLPPLTVIILPFEDRRMEKGRLGTRTHLWGGETHFDVPGGKPGDMVAEQLAEYLRQHGWQAAVANTASGSGGKADVTLKGQVLDMAANARSRLGSTRMTARVKLALQIANTADGSVAHVTVGGARSDTEIVFEPQYLSNLFNDVLSDSFERLLASAKVEGRTLQVR
jgi:hypothetical protein